MIRRTAMPLDICAAAAGAAFGYEVDESERAHAGLRTTLRFAMALGLCALFGVTYVLI